jgi:saccharopine dehydrogenase (NADP+, L-glutamate forming)
MKNILIIGAGRSSSALIKYLLNHSKEFNWKVKVGDSQIEFAKSKVQNHPNGEAIKFDINNEKDRETEIDWADVVVSMLPATMHINVAKDCLRLKKHLVTASYVSKEMAQLNEEVKSAGLLFLNEVGLDPGIDHMSAMQIINEIKAKGANIISFKSFCGGLVAPESNDNPWGYKFTWNPRNVILAGQGTAQYIEENELKYIPYNRIFTQIEPIVFDGIGTFDAYANRDSLSYREPYGLKSIPTLLRGTLRYAGYCRSWNVFVKLGLTDDSYILNEIENKTYSELINSFLPKLQGSLKNRLIQFMGQDASLKDIEPIEWLGMLDGSEKIRLKLGSPAQILQDLLERKWMLKPQDLDLVLMQHLFEYILDGRRYKITSSLVVKGIDQTYTAMANTVGLPAAICVKLLLTDKIKSTGVIIPVSEEIYEPVLKELISHNIVFQETETEL